MATVKWRVIVIVSVLTILPIGIIAHSQNTKPETKTSKDQLIKELRAQIEQLQTIIKTQEAEIQRLKVLCKKIGIDTKPEAEKEKVVMPKYSILDEDIYDAPIKTQVVLNILVSGEISEAGLRALLNNLYSSTKAKRGFKYRKSPSNIYIYAFTSKERAESGMGQWIAMLQESPSDIRPGISINKRQIAQLGAEPEERFGLSEAKRIEIWKEYVLAEDMAWEKAEERYPFNPGLSQSQFQKQAEKLTEFRQQLEKQYKGELAKKYGLTLEQLKEIVDEGVTKDWPLPK